MQTMKRFFPLILLIALGAGIFGYLQWNKPHTDVSQSPSDIAIAPSELLAQFNTDENAANSKYLDKIIEVEGIVKSINPVQNGGSVSLDASDDMASVTCEFENLSDISEIKLGDKVKVKGLCSGKLIDVVLNRCALSK
jgi:hypothetical protein